MVGGTSNFRIYYAKCQYIISKSTTFLSVDHLEIEANKFAMECLLTDEDIKENKEYTMEQLSRIFGYSEKLIELRLK